jgi:hypothetical protein
VDQPLPIDLVIKQGEGCRLEHGCGCIWVWVWVVGCMGVGVGVGAYGCGCVWVCGCMGAHECGWVWEARGEGGWAATLHAPLPLGPDHMLPWPPATTPGTTSYTPACAPPLPPNPHGYLPPTQAPAWCTLVTRRRAWWCGPSC